ncbi:rhomboid family intramembrane serine protease [Streptomyces litchfieldiae]|uniref:Rhomboid family intramembrane serine protease n=1 Tax=Streptomyces litchfieldiae TaxID=3075543 RepID=A0ABU2MKI9_9ACTN|nr:rhomboid family intramembrane serine protease [Streptomyces sp. DSM 44938]MDT0342123.1 rhomboid family intramembrane serine protease [Streptomyces sp. DSM 44938]
MAEPQGQPQPAAGPARCYRHPDRETGIRCTRCGRPICPACMISAPVGYQCPDCVQGAARATRVTRPRTLAGGAVTADTRLITMILIGINVAMFVATLAGGDEFVADFGMLGYFGYTPDLQTITWIGVADGEWYRMLTSAFLHEQFWHIAVNMLSLWFLGPALEAALGRVRFLALYLLSALAGSTLSYVLADPDQLSLGASGAIFGLFGATAVLARRLRYDMRSILILLGFNLVLTFTWSGIAWQAHIGGLVAGAAIGFGMLNAPREHRTLVQVGTCVALVVVMAVACAARTAQLLG